MLESLIIRDFALIERVDVRWTEGLNVLTGETGAGKSVLMDALSAVLGGKAGPSCIRNGAEKASIEATFAPSPLVVAWAREQQLIDEEVAEIVISREITRSGSRIRINGTLVNQSIVQDLGKLLLTVHAQHEARTLMSPQAQLELLDGLGPDPHRKNIEKHRTLYARKRELQQQLSELQVSEDERLRRLDFARFQLSELTEARLSEENEDHELTCQVQKLSNVVQLESAAGRAQAALNGEGSGGGGGGSDSEERCALDLLQLALSEVERAARYDDVVDHIAESLRSSLACLEDSISELRRYRDGLDGDPESLANAETRLAALATIKRKYGPTLKEAIARQDALSDEIERLEGSQEQIEELTREFDEVEEDLKKSAATISSARVKLSRELSRAVEKELADLGMDRCRFEIGIQQQDVGPFGSDRIEFMIAPNPGQPAMPLAKIASGGELSRIMLAIKSIFAAADRVPTVIFDEIDTGLSGKVLQSMRDKLSALSKSHQILCITHQPIIAAVANNHIEVQKRHNKTSTFVSAAMLEEEDRVKALAGMASGQEDEEVALNFARSLMQQR